ncbi:FG-GAP repeat domain-containing protein [Thermogemmatispora sp.]|uniref:FG-GAP repeat domain-containing protein n=1 Tax=Thermogemmatispora sp. TaxID=1968838 RepID=UPI0035E423B0
MTIQLRQPPGVTRKRQAITGEEEDDAIYLAPRLPSSTRRYQPLPPASADVVGPLSGITGPQPAVFIQRRRASSQMRPEYGTTSKAVVPEGLRTVAPTRIKARRSGRSWLWALRAILLGLLLTALLGLGLAYLGSWWQLHQEDVQFGRPRTWQMDAVVGHNDSPSHPTHFVFINLNRHVEIIEFPGGDGSSARVYNGPVLFGPNQDLVPITAEVHDVNGDGRPDLIVHIGEQRLVLLNEGDTFRPATAADHISL